MKQVFFLFVFLLLFGLNSERLSALPGSQIEIDGSQDDWEGAACFLDDGGIDDNQGLDRSDITEFCLHIDPDDIDGGLYFLYAWDDTSFPNSAAARVVLDTDGNLIPDYSVGNAINYSRQAGYFAEGVTVGVCGDALCSLGNVQEQCSDQGGPHSNDCDGTLSAAGNDRPSPYTSANCTGDNCQTQDGYVEMFIPWSQLGDTPPGDYLFGLYLSSHSGGTEDGSSDVTGNGVSCTVNGCYQSEPSALSLVSLGVETGGVTAVTLILIGFAWAGMVSTALLINRKRRQT